MFDAYIIDIYSKRIRDVSEKEAMDDGFENKEEFRQEIIKINRVKSLSRWGFIIKFINKEWLK